MAKSSAPIPRWTLLGLALVISLNVQASPLPRPFKCAGDPTQICETGFCYDALGFYEGGKNVGCALPEMCQEVGCFLHENVFTCCCASRFCNGKTESLMWSKYRRFQSNGNVWPTFFPKVFARNVTTPIPQDDSDEEPPEIRLSPVRTTTPINPPSPPQKTVLVTRNELPEYKTTTTTKKPQPKTTKAIVLPTAKPTTTSTTTTTTTPKATTVKSTTQKTTTTTRQKAETPRFVSAIEAAKAEVEGEEIIEQRTTRSNGNTQPTPAPTTVRQRRPQHHVHKFEPRTEAPPPAPKRDAVVQQAFPWYVVTIIGFLLACALFTVIAIFIRRCRRNGEQQRRGSDHSLPNSSLESSRVSEADANGLTLANEKGDMVADPLLKKPNRR